MQFLPTKCKIQVQICSKGYKTSVGTWHAQADSASLITQLYPLHLRKNPFKMYLEYIKKKKNLWPKKIEVLMNLS